MTPQSTLEHHLQAFAQGADGVDEIMRDYTDASVVLTAGGPQRGMDAIRALFHDFFTTSPPELLRAATIVHHVAEGEIGYVVWKAEPFIPLGTDTFHIRDGKILVQTVTVYTPPSAD